MPAGSSVPLLLLLSASLLLPAASHAPAGGGGGGRRVLLPRRALEASPGGGSFDPSRLRRALRALLELNDGELRALMMGASPGAVATRRLSPSTAFLLASSRRHLRRLSAVLATTGGDAPLDALTWNPRIARRRKKWRRRSRRRQPDGDADADGGSSSILEALTELSASLAQEDDGGARRRRSHNTLEARGSTQYEAHHHYLYYLRSGECPRAPDGRPKMFCPTPTPDGRWICIEEEDLCDGAAQCPAGQDEAPTHCLFHSAMRTHLDELTKFVMLSRLT